jgi:hypothetical protein
LPSKNVFKRRLIRPDIEKSMPERRFQDQVSIADHRTANALRTPIAIWKKRQLKIRVISLVEFQATIKAINPKLSIKDALKVEIV